MSLEIEATDVIKLILQFLKEHNLQRTLQTLQEETNVSLNVVDDLNGLIENIQNGRWGLVLQTISNVRISTELQYDLFEHIVLELIENNEKDIANEILHLSIPCKLMKTSNIQRWQNLYDLIKNKNANKNININFELRRNEIAEEVKSQIFQIPPSRLLTIINQSLKYQQLIGNLPKGISYDILRGDMNNNDNNQIDNRDREDKIIRKNTCLIKFGKHRAKCCTFSMDGQLLITGSNDGFVEIWDFDNGQLRTDLKCQTNDELMFLNDGEEIISLALTKDCELLAVGGNHGNIKIFQTYIGTCLATFANAHLNAITSLEFNNDGTQLLSSSLDHTIKVHGLRSKCLLKEFVGHTSFVNHAMYSSDNLNIISCSSDWTIRIFNAKNSQCIRIIENIPNLLVANENNELTLYLNEMYGSKPIDNNDYVLKQEQGTSSTTGTITTPTSNDNNNINTNTNTNNGNLSIHKILFNPNCKNNDEIYVINDSLIIYIINIKKGIIVKTIQSQRLLNAFQKKKEKNVNYHNSFIDMTLSSRAQYIYVIDQEAHLYAFNTITNKLVSIIKIHEQLVDSLHCHPHRNILATTSEDCTLKIWRP